MGTLPCPHAACTGGPFSNKHGLTSHLHQFHGSEHGYDTWAEAEERAEEVVENPETAEGSTPAEVEGPPSDGRSENPLLRAPSPGEGGTPIVCPECDRPVERIGENLQVEGDHDGETVSGETDKNDYYCQNCQLITDTEGTILHNVNIGN